MSIIYCEGNLLHSDADVLVNPVNCVGVMGKGLALGFKKDYPKNFQAYRQACETGQIRIGKTFVFPFQERGRHRWIVNFPTKDDWREPSRLGYIESGLLEFESWLRCWEDEHNEVRSIAIPALGCGLGGLRWEKVRPLIRRLAKRYDDYTWEIYPPK